MKTSWTTPVGFVLVLLGLVWTAQGLGWLEGSPMTDVRFWAFAGAATAALGLLLVIVGLRSSERRDDT